jgi:predicted RNase H-like nuclease
MRFLGIDFGWQGRPSGVASLGWDGRVLTLRALDRLQTAGEVLEWIAREAGRHGAMIAVDAPTIIVNPTGRRPAEAEAQRKFARFHAGCHPANLERPFAAHTVAFGRSLEAMGFAHACLIEPRRAGRYQIEVHPHSAAVRLFALDRIVKYKKGTVAQRAAELERFRGLLLHFLPRLRPAVAGLTLPAATAPLKDAEDRFDALLAAYTGAHWWYWGTERNEVLGDGETGYIVVPLAASKD